MMRLPKKYLLVVSLVAVGWVATCFAAEHDGAVVDGRVVGVTDGDTIVMFDGAEQIKVRLAEIDAPEKAQPFGQASKRALSDLCFEKTARLAAQGTDRYGRTLGRVQCDGVDVNALQVRSGMAWVYDKYVTDRRLYQLQDEARAERRGYGRDLTRCRRGRGGKGG